MSSTRAAAKILHDTAEPLLHETISGALARAGMTLDDAKLVVVNTPTAWYADFAARALHLDPERTLSVYPLYSNVGPVLMPANLAHAAAGGRLARGDVVVAYAVGSSSTASAIVMRWGDPLVAPIR
jgi:3-oxoacyl-[acyl-carrier-protein] synthase-3